MFNIGNDDMDDAFRKAAQEYELNDEFAANWKNVHEALQHEQPQVVKKADKERRRRFIFWWCLLLVPAALLIAYESGVLPFNKNQTNFLKENETHDSVTLHTRQKNAQKSGNDNAEESKNLIESNSQSTVQIERFSLSGSKRQSGNTHSLTDFDNHSSVHQKPESNSLQLSISTNDFRLQNKDADMVKQNNTDLTSRNLVVNNAVNNSITTSAKPDTLTNNNTNAGVIQTASAKDSTLHPVAKQKKNVQHKYKSETYNYFGLTGNADLSFIKNQRASNVGWSFGITGGHHFKNGISVETGVLFDKKNYYTKGKYFDKSGLNEYLQMVDLLKANGNCKMWEIPLDLRYDFATKKKYNWFVAAGVSSYFMSKENYDFTYQFNNDVKTHSYSYKHSSSDWFSVMNVGAGVNIKSGDQYLLQVQPYYKVPLSGVGKGKLSLSSAGLNISILRRIN